MNPIEELIEGIKNLNLWNKSIELSRNDFLKVKGTIDTNLYFIVSGSLRIFVFDESEEHTIRFGYQNNIIAALDSYITNQPSDLCIQVLKKTSLKVISKESFTAFVKNSPENTRLWQTILGQLIYQQMERERDLLTSSPTERYARVLRRSPQLFQEIPNKYIASYLRMTPETFSRVSKKTLI